MLPQKYILTIRNSSGATCDVKALVRPNTVADDGAGQTEPVYAAEQTLAANATLPDSAESDSVVQTNSAYLGIEGLLVVVPASSASGRVELWMKTVDDSGSEISSTDFSRFLTYVELSDATAQNGSFLVQ